MMVEKYIDLLPNYLRGNNITNHANLVDYEVKKILSILNDLSFITSLDKPLLIQKDQTFKEKNSTNYIFNVDYIIHINLDSECLKSINISGDYLFSKDYDEEENVINEEITVHFEKQFSWQDIWIYNPRILVTVETYDGNTYIRGYPENDVVTGDNYDHDPLLDVLGQVLGIPRKMYEEYQSLGGTSDGIYLIHNEQIVYPAFMGKEYDLQGNILLCSEDDYYYIERLKRFISLYAEDYIKALAYSILNTFVELKPLYDRDSSIIEGSTSSYTRGEYCAFIPVKNVEIWAKKRPSPHTEEIIDYSFQRYPNLSCSGFNNILSNNWLITRRLYFLSEVNIVLASSLINNSKYINDLAFNISLTTTTNNNIINAPLKVSLLCNSFNNDSEFQLFNTDIVQTDNNGTVIYRSNNINRDFTKIKYKIEYEGEYEIIGTLFKSNPVVLDMYSFKEGLFEYGLDYNSTIDTPDLVTPTGHTEYLDVGKGYLSYLKLPVIHSLNENQCIEVYHDDYTEKPSIYMGTRIFQTDNGIYLKDIIIPPELLNPNGVLTFEVYNGIIYAFEDSEYIGKWSFSNKTDFYLGIASDTGEISTQITKTDGTLSSVPSKTVWVGVNDTSVNNNLSYWITNGIDSESESPLVLSGEYLLRKHSIGYLQEIPVTGDFIMEIDVMCPHPYYGFGICKGYDDINGLIPVFSVDSNRYNDIDVFTWNKSGILNSIHLEENLIEDVFHKIILKRVNGKYELFYDDLEDKRFEIMGTNDAGYFYMANWQNSIFYCHNVTYNI